MKLFIVDSQRRKSPLELPGSETLLDLKKSLFETSKIPTHCQNVSVRKGKKQLWSFTMDDEDQTLEELELKDDDVIEYEPMRLHIHHVNWNEGQTITMDEAIHPGTTIEEIKTLVEQKANIPSREQRVVFYERFLDDPNETIGDHGFEHDDTFEIQDGITVTVKHKPTGKVLFQQASEPNDTIYTMKHHIQQTVHILVDKQEVFWKKKELTDNEATLRETGILNGDVLEFNNEIAGMEFQIRLPTQEIFTISNVNPVTDTIDELKLRIQEIHTIPKAIQYLDFMGTNLTDPTKTLMECRIQNNGDLIDLTPHRRKLTPVEEMILTIQQHKGTDRGDGDEDNAETLCQLIVLPKDTIRDVKKKIQNKTKILMFLQQLSHEGTLLGDDRPTLHYLGIKSKETLVLVKLPMEVKVRIKYPEKDKPDETIVISYLDRFDTLGDVQQKLEEAFGLSVEKQNLFYRGKEFSSSKEKHQKRDKAFQESSLFDLRIKHSAILDLKIEPKPKPKPKPPPPPPPPPPPKEPVKQDNYQHNGCQYTLHEKDWDWCKITKAQKRDKIGLTFLKDPSDGNYYVDEIDPNGAAIRFSIGLKPKARLMKFQEKDATKAYATEEEMHKIMKQEMIIIFETIPPKAVYDESAYDYGDDFEKGDVVTIDGGPSQAEIMRKTKGGKWMVKVVDTGKVMLIQGTQLTKE
jgi:hypothetical protein